MKYLVSRKVVGLNFLVEVVRATNKNFTVGEVYESDNYIYCDERNFVTYQGFTVNIKSEIDLIKDAVNIYKIDKRLNKLNKI